MFSEVQQIREGCFIYIKNPYLFVVIGQFEALRIEQNLVYNNFRVVPLPAQAGQLRNVTAMGARSWPKGMDLVGDVVV
ncbi:hypothetical protein QYF36_001428 [Acer negundo]|nr:hypothetical protein QYF36_001428 [Acer negundo]